MIGGRGLEVYDIANNQITGATFLGTVGLEWQFAGVAPVHGPGASDLVLRKVNTGQFEVYDIANNQLTGASSLGSVGLDWQVRGFAAGPPSSAGHLSHEPLGLGIMDDARTWSHAFLFSPYGAGSRRHLDERFSAPEVLKPIRSQLGVTHRVLDVLVAEPSL
jgi:hypothetical protein